MIWNRQQPDWTDFRFDKSRLDPQEAWFLHSAGVVLGTIKHLDARTTEQLTLTRFFSPPPLSASPAVYALIL